MEEHAGSEDTLLIKDNCDIIVKQVMDERDILMACSLKDYQNLSSLQALVESLSNQLKSNESFIQDFISAVTKTRVAMESLNDTIVEKIDTEHVQNWLPRTDFTGRFSHCVFHYTATFY